MAEILIRISDGQEGHYAGDPVWVNSDGATWGRLESLDVWVSEGNAAESWPNKGVLVLLSVPINENTLNYLKDEDQTLRTSRDKLGDQVQHDVTIRARKHKIDLSLLSLSAEDILKISSGGMITLTASQFNQAVSDRLPDVALKNIVLARLKVKDPSVIEI